MKVAVKVSFDSRVGRGEEHAPTLEAGRVTRKVYPEGILLQDSRKHREKQGKPGQMGEIDPVK
jgi:hypothetical protein